MFAHLHLHTEYSLLDGACRIQPLMERLKEMGMTSCAVTDHGVMYGVVDFYRAAKEAGGLGLCTNAQGKAVFTSTDDPDYKTLLALVEDAKSILDSDPRFDMPKFCPNPEYLREMKRYGILPPDVDPAKQCIDPYATVAIPDLFDLADASGNEIITSSAEKIIAVLIVSSRKIL